VISYRNFYQSSKLWRLLRLNHLPFELGTERIKADGEETRQSSYNSNRV
jgi:hypothetical protein